MNHALLFCMALALSPAVPSMPGLSGVAHAADTPWWQDEWKTPPADGAYIVLRLGVNQRGVLNLYQGETKSGGGPITYTLRGDSVLVTRNGVTVTFALDHATKIVKTADGSPMARLKATAGATGGCEEACWANNASTNDLQKRYGTAEAPASLSFGRSHTEAAGQAAYNRCMEPHGLAGFTDPVIGERCNQRSSDACIESCTAAGHPR
jgi:hypothetical protein